MANDQQHANGALSDREHYDLDAILTSHTRLALGGDPIHANQLTIRAIRELLAARPASYTLEQIGVAHNQTHDFVGAAIYRDRLLSRLTAPKPKTAEESLAEIASKYAITLDEKDRAKYFTEIITALKESEAHNG